MADARDRAPAGAVCCTICGDTEPSHVHANGERIDDYFTVGRGETEMEAAQRWHRRAIAADRLLIQWRIHGRPVDGGSFTSVSGEGGEEG